MLTLSLEKPGAAPAPKLRLSLSKGTRFTLRVDWQCNAAHEDDVDIHALEARNDGQAPRCPRSTRCCPPTTPPR